MCKKKKNNTSIKLGNKRIDKTHLFSLTLSKHTKNFPPSESFKLHMLFFFKDLII